MRCTLIKSGSIPIKFSCLFTRMNAEVGNITFADTMFFITTVLPKAALLSCARFTCDIYVEYFLLLLNNIEVQKLRSKLTGYMYVTYTLVTNPSTDGQR